MLQGILNGLGLAYWIEIRTDRPVCTYYFGPYSRQSSAAVALDGFLDDLRQEGAEIVASSIDRRREPEQLTVTEDWGDLSLLGRVGH
jgi:hypothetical protein